ncbi:MAG: type IX secretion system sortase PorU, partial [Cyclobacteriaceae bacterium]
ETDLQLPVPIGTVANQSLRSIPPPDLLIITHPTLRAQGVRLAAFRRTHDQLDVEVVTTTEVYNEFSSGRQDITAIRDFARHLYLLNPSKLSYLLLMGHASYDYKSRIDGNLNLVPTYQSRNSYHNVFSYSSDDYYGFMEDNEGEWQESSLANDHTLELGIGRIPAKNVAEAEDMVNKLVHYATAAETLGPWRNRLLFVADDGDGNIHQRDADRLCQFMDTTYRAYNIKKLYLDSYRQQVRADRETSPAAREALNDAIKNGQFIVNYSGHGGPLGWARETILDQNLISQWDNLDKLPMFVTATCEFGQHDDPSQISAGEKLLLKPDGGAIGLVTTTRPVYSYTNYLLNREFYKHISASADKPKPIGEIFRETKNSSINGVNNRNFTLLGDPSMMPAYPRKGVVIESINGYDPALRMDTLRAMSQAVIQGRVTDVSGSTDTNFNGRAEVVLFDKPVKKETFGTEGAAVFQYDEQDNVLFRGQSSVFQGHFNLQVPLPRNLDYNLGKGKLSLYALSESGTSDARGAEYRLFIGGTASNVSYETTPPQIKLFLNDTTFSDGDVISEAAFLLATFSDESGINVSRNGIGQDIRLTINDENTVVLNDFYTSVPDDYTTGTIVYPLSDLSPGKNTIRLEAWDNLNNKGESLLSFVVSDGNDLVISDAGNYPNPFRSETTFIFKHNKPGADLTVTVDIVDIHGRIVNTLNQYVTASSSTIETETWDGTDQYGNPINAGMYLYRISVEDDQGFKKAVVKRLVCVK